MGEVTSLAPISHLFSPIFAFFHVPVFQKIRRAER